MKIWVIRHGQTDWNSLKKIQGKTDIELNDVGRMQAKDASEKIKDEKIDLIISSPLKRARETAEIINLNFEIPIIEDERLMERGWGKCEGLTKGERSKLKEKYPEVEYIWNYNENVGFNDIEKMKDFVNRIYNFLDELIEKYKDKQVLLVTHGGTSAIIQCYFEKFPLEKFINRDVIKRIENCEVSYFEV